MNNMMQNLMREATRLTRSGNLREATAAIQRALGKAGGAPISPPPPVAMPSPIILDGCVFEVAQPDVAQAEPARPEVKHPDAGMPETVLNPRSFHAGAALGEFTEGSHTHASLTRRYKLYTPPGSVDSTGKSLPLIVMLHGCTQNPDDFAAGTGMNELAREQGFYVLYPAQSADANPQRCWNWFKHTHQSRGRGEAALLASMTLSIMQQHRIDARRVYIAGLSAGGAMAAIVAAAYPDIYAAVGVHSGLAVGAASNVAEALAAMRSGAKSGAGGRAGNGAGSGAGSGKARDHASPASTVPTIVFHGDQDATVHPRNGEQVSEQALAVAPGRSTKHVAQGVSTQGRRFTRTVHRRINDAQTDGGFGSGSGAFSGTAGSGLASSTVAEHWVVHGAGHAWSGGDAKGSYTDPKGPDASREMLRFFLAHSLPEN